MRKEIVALIIVLGLMTCVSSPASAQSGGYLTKHYLSSLGSHTDINNGWTYIWYDADRDGIIDLTEEVETVVSSTSEHMSTSSYPEGGHVTLFSDADGYYPRDGAYALPQVATEDDSAVPIGNMQLMKMTTALNVYLFTGYIANGTQTFLDVVMTIPDNDAGFGSHDMIDFNSGIVFTDPILVISVEVHESFNVMFEDYDQSFTSPTFSHYFWEFEQFFNDADVETDGVFSMGLQMDVLAPFSLYITIYDTMREDHFENGVVSLPTEPTFVFNGTDNQYNITQPRIYFQDELSWEFYEGFKTWGWSEDGGQAVWNDGGNEILPFNFEDPMMLFFLIFTITTLPVFWRFVKPKRKSSPKAVMRTKSTTTKPKPKPKPRWNMDADIYMFEGDKGEDYE